MIDLMLWFGCGLITSIIALYIMGRAGEEIVEGSHIAILIITFLTGAFGLLLLIIGLILIGIAMLEVKLNIKIYNPFYRNKK